MCRWCVFKIFVGASKIWPDPLCRPTSASPPPLRRTPPPPDPPSAGQPKISLFFFSPAGNFFLSSLWEVFSWNFWWCFGRSVPTEIPREDAPPPSPSSGPTLLALTFSGLLFVLFVLLILLLVAACACCFWATTVESNPPPLPPLLCWTFQNVNNNFLQSISFDLDQL